MTNRLVVENLKHRPVRTLLSSAAIGVQVCMILTLVGVSRGMLTDMANRTRGGGADIIIRAPGSAIIGFSTNFSANVLPVVQKMDHVDLATGVLVQPIGGIDSITGIDLDRFSAMSGGFRYLEGAPWTGTQEIVVDEVWAKTKKIKAGDTQNLLNTNWRVAGVVEAGKLSRVFAPLSLLQDLSANTGKLTAIYVKLDDKAHLEPVIAALKDRLTDYRIYSIDEFSSLFSVDNIPMLRQFISVIIGLGLLIGFLVVFLSMYTAVLERTREIGILKALGASPGFIVGILLRETALLALVGSAIGILFTYGTRLLITTLVPNMTQVIVPDWWPIATVIAIVGAMIGAVYPGLKAARQDAIEALSYD
ncbi:MAG: ABC transporter permease [Bryobacteraceae bacterium]|nr:ABC transporter permease [Bryobacteraceae bacterium]